MSTIVHCDELQMIQMLMHNTTLEIKVGTQLAPGFESTISCPQGDSLSPVLFTCYLEAALKKLRSRVLTQHFLLIFQMKLRTQMMWTSLTPTVPTWNRS